MYIDWILKNRLQQTSISLQVRCGWWLNTYTWQRPYTTCNPINLQYRVVDHCTLYSTFQVRSLCKRYINSQSYDSSGSLYKKGSKTRTCICRTLSSLRLAHSHAYESVNNNTIDFNLFSCWTYTYGSTGGTFVSYYLFKYYIFKSLVINFYLSMYIMQQKLFYNISIICQGLTLTCGPNCSVYVGLVVRKCTCPVYTFIINNKDIVIYILLIFFRHFVELPA